jgi:hypothetical protein
MKRIVALLLVLACVGIAYLGGDRISAAIRSGSTTEIRSKLSAGLDSAMARASSLTEGNPETRATRIGEPSSDSGRPVAPKGLVIGGDCPPPDSLPKATTASLIPLEAGLTLAHIWNRSSRNDEEYECLLQVTAVTSSYADVTYSCDRHEPARRRVCLSDLRVAHFYLTEAGLDQPPETSGATMFSLSTRSLQQLKSTTNTAHRFIEIANGWRQLKQPLRVVWDGNLHSGRLDRQSYPIIVNDRVLNVPVLKGVAFGDTPEHTSVIVLDNEALPIVLDYSVPFNGFRIRFTKISFPTNGALEKELEVEKHADVYGIYFDFASDHLRPESTPVLDEIAALLTKNGTWKLSINGHTDNIGGDAANLPLSRRRSIAVRTALVERYHIDGARLATSGFGASQPKASNTTPEGRSANRRVELVRQ